MFVNCMTYALELENIDISCLDLRLWYSRDPESEIREKVGRFNRSIRKLENEKAKLKNNEWLIAFFGFIPTHYDYEGLPDEYDYHFIKCENGIWFHRPSIGEDISPVEPDLFTKFEANGYPAKFFAVKKVEA